MWRLALTVVLWNTISSQPVTDDAHSTCPPGRVDFMECCPCPGSRAAQELAAAGSDVVSRAAPLDDCPCRVRDPDSQGSTSDILPRAVRPHRPLMTLDDSKENVKPLLKPEVGLASSMLETLREVTDEEYQEALARDAARNAARVAELGDAQPDTAKNILTIIVNPTNNDARDATAEASELFESNCIPPSNAGQVREAETTPTFKRKPNLVDAHLQDMDSGASERQEEVIGMNKGLDDVKLKISPSILKLFPARKSEGNIQSLLKLKNNKIPKDAKEVPKNMNGHLKPMLPGLKLHSLFRKNEVTSPIKPLGLGINKFNIPKIKTSSSRKQQIKDCKNDDSNPSPSNIQEQFSDPITAKNTPSFDLKSLLSASDITKTPFSLSNLLNLKDVELIPPKTPKLNLPDLKLLPSLRVNKPGTDFTKRKNQQILIKDCDSTAKRNEEDSNFQRDQRIHTEILDTVPHPSELNPVIVVNDIEATTIGKDNTNVLSKDEELKTNILDALPSASENNEMVFVNDVAVESSTPVLQQEDIDFDEDFKPQNVEIDEPVKKLSKDDVENVDTNNDSIEITIENEGNKQFEELEIVEETDQPMNEIEISGSALDLEGQQVDLELNDDDGTNVENTSFTFNINNDEHLITEEENIDLKGFEFEPEQNLDENEDTSGVEDFFRPNSQEDLENQNTLAETSNQNIQIASVEEIEETEFLHDYGLNNKQLQEYELKPVRKGNFRSSIKQKSSENLKSLTNPATKDRSTSQLNNLNACEKNVAAAEKNSFDSDESLRQDEEKFLGDVKSAEMTSNKTNQVNIQFLQQMSDSLLRKSENDKRDRSQGATLSTGVSFGNTDTTEIEKETYLTGNKNVDANTDMESSATSLKNNVEIFGKTKEIFQNDINNNARAHLKNSKLVESTDNTCSSHLQSDKAVSVEKSASNLASFGESEMESGASETFFNTVPSFKSTVENPLPLLQQSIVVQPASLFPQIQPLDLSKVSLPTLDDIRSSISSLLGGNARSADDEETSSTDFELADECSDSSQVMSSDASTTKIKSAFPPLRPLENINLDIFQINPLSLDSSLGSKLPSLNLNSFKTKLALPKSLNLKPMKLQSALGGKNGGMLGATLTFGSEKSSSRKAKPVTKLGSILNRQGYDILGNPLANMPTLEDLRSTMRANTQSLLKSPLISPFDDTLRTTEAFGNSLRSHTENTMRNIQQSLSSTLNEARVSNFNNAGVKYAKPQDLLEKVSLAHEDVKDKLYGIHVDLQDRLSSIHNSILDRTNLQIPTLQSPLLSGLGIAHETSMQSSRPAQPKLIIRKQTALPRTNKPMLKNKEQNKGKPFKMSKAASSLTPKIIEVPKLRATSSKPPFLRPLKRDESVKLKQTKPIFSNDHSQKPVKNEFKPFGIQTKITISTTPRPARFSTRPTARPQISVNSALVGSKQPTSFRANNKPVEQLRSFDSSDFASEPKLVKVPAPDHVASTKFEISEGRGAIQSGSVPSSQTSLPEFALRNPLKRIPTLKPLSSVKLPLPKSTPSLLTLPKPTESPLVSKMREAIRIRLSHPQQDKSRTGAVGKSCADEMTRSASENTSVVVKQEPIKENISYKCKMVCVRD